MSALFSLVAVLALLLLGMLGAQAEGLRFFFGAILPYVAFVLFIVGLVYKVVKWARTPVPFRIPTTCGQAKSLPWIKQSKLESPSSTFWVIARMFLEVVFFRSLFRNTRTELSKDGPKVAYGPTKWLWLAGLAFHYTMLVIVFRHLRFFTEPVPFVVGIVQDVDGFFQIGVPVFYLTSVIFLASVTYLFLRRVLIPQVRYVSLANDYFPLFLLLGIGTTGFLLRHLMKTDIVAVKELTLGLIGFNPAVPAEIHPLFFGHLFLVCVLIAYFPASKLTHMAGVFLSPTRNLANNNREIRHVNPWNYPVKLHTYEEYEDEFRDKMKAAGVPVEKE
jgi:nitrate reductase gamma subunit